MKNLTPTYLVPGVDGCDYNPLKTNDIQSEIFFLALDKSSVAKWKVPGSNPVGTNSQFLFFFFWFCQIQFIQLFDYLQERQTPF